MRVEREGAKDGVAAQESQTDSDERRARGWDWLERAADSQHKRREKKHHRGKEKKEAKPAETEAREYLKQRRFGAPD